MKHARALVWLCITVALGAATWCAAERYPGFSGLACVLTVIAMFRTADEFRAAATPPTSSGRRATNSPAGLP